jgi:hypothetical protein
VNCEDPGCPYNISTDQQTDIMTRRLALYLIIQVVILTGLPSFSEAQESASAKKNDFWSRVIVGGNIGFQIGDITGVNVSPEIAVRLIDQLYGGLGFTYQYTSYKNYYYDTKSQQYLNFTMSTYGGRIFFRYYLASLFDSFLGNIFLHTEYEYLTYTRPYTYDPYGSIIDPYNNGYRQGHELIEVNSLFVGGGYHQPVSGKVFMDLLILYNLNDSYNSPYSNPLFRIGVGVGL